MREPQIEEHEGTREPQREEHEGTRDDLRLRDDTRRLLRIQRCFFLLLTACAHPLRFSSKHLFIFASKKCPWARSFNPFGEKCEAM